jgi:ribosome-binding factor A
MSQHRIKRVESLLAEEIGRLIVNGEIKDPRVDPLLSVNGIKVSKDLQYAHVRISGYLEPENLKAGVEALNHGAGFIQQQLSRRLRFRVTPKLTFLEDRSIGEGFEITRKIKDALD